MLQIEDVVIICTPQRGASEADSVLDTETAGRLNNAFPRSALSLSNTGSPRPAGSPVATTSATPPIEFCVARASSMRATI